MKHISQHTCESAIYHNRPDFIAELCTLKFLEGFRPKCQIIEMTNFIMLIVMPSPWVLYCNKALDIPAKLDENPLAMIRRKDLCNCAFSAGPYYIHKNIISCEDQEWKSTSGIGIYYTVNTVTADFFRLWQKLTKLKIG